MKHLRRSASAVDGDLTDEVHGAIGLLDLHDGMPQETVIAA
jgi:hypothetical protein